MINNLFVAYKSTQGVIKFQLCLKHTYRYKRRVNMSNKSPPKFYTIKKLSDEEYTKFKDNDRLVALQDDDGNVVGHALYNMNSSKWEEVRKFVNINYADNAFGKHQLSGTIKDGKWNTTVGTDIIFLMNLRLTGTPDNLRKYAEEMERLSARYSKEESVAIYKKLIDLR